MIFLDCDSIDHAASGFFQATMATSGFSDGDTVRIVVTGDVNNNIVFVGGLLHGDSKTFGIPSTAFSDSKGASFQLAYVASASKWAILSTNGVATF